MLLAVAVSMVLGLFALEGRFTPKKPAADKIVFVSDRAGHPDIWMMNADGSDPQPLTSDVYADASPAWSADATRVVFTSERDGLAQVFTRQSTRDQQPQQITVGSGVKLQPLFSPDGRSIAYVQQGRVFLSNSDGSDVEPLLPPIESGATAEEFGVSNPYVQIDWSADGQSLAAVRRVERLQFAQILMSLDEEPQAIAYPDGVPISSDRLSVRWAPRGGKIAVSIVSRDTGVIAVQDYKGEKSFGFIVKGVATGRLAWSPSGEQIAFEVLGYRETHGYSTKALAVAEVDSALYVIVARGDVSGPSWTPDGKKVVFTKVGKGGLRDVWSVNPDGTGAKNLTAGRGDNHDAQASPVTAD